MKKILIGFTGLLAVVLITAFTFGNPDNGKEKKKAKEEVKKECVSTQASGCPGHAAMKTACDPAKCQGTCDPAKCQGTCDPAKCKNGTSSTCTGGTCDPAKCTKHTTAEKK
jgi:hypothetical protein